MSPIRSHGMRWKLACAVIQKASTGVTVSLERMFSAITKTRGRQRLRADKDGKRYLSSGGDAA